MPVKLTPKRSNDNEPLPKYIQYFALGMVGFVIGHAVTKGVFMI